MEKLNIILSVCRYIENKEHDEARALIESQYKHEHIKCNERQMSSFEKLKIYIRDGFINRYNGEKLLFPNILRIITKELGNKYFPFHVNWKMSECHIAYWNYMPTYDHIVPIARGGEDIPENIITTSQIMNSAKSNFLVEELGWVINPPGKIEDWDGMISWYIKYREQNSTIFEDNYLKRWDAALKKCVSQGIYKLITNG